MSEKTFLFSFKNEMLLFLTVSFLISLTLGCSSLPKRKYGIFGPEVPVVPEIVLEKWTEPGMFIPDDDEYKKARRGVGGVVRFYQKDHLQRSLMVDGDLIVYVFDGGEHGANLKPPIAKLFYDSEKLNEKHRRYDKKLGYSYHVWVDLGEIDDFEQTISLCCVFNDKNGEQVATASTPIFVPGSPKPDTLDELSSTLKEHKGKLTAEDWAKLYQQKRKNESGIQMVNHETDRSAQDYSELHALSPLTRPDESTRFSTDNTSRVAARIELSDQMSRQLQTHPNQNNPTQNNPTQYNPVQNNPVQNTLMQNNSIDSRQNNYFNPSEGYNQNNSYNQNDSYNQNNNQYLNQENYFNNNNSWNESGNFSQNESGSISGSSGPPSEIETIKTIEKNKSIETIAENRSSNRATSPFFFRQAPRLTSSEQQLGFETPEEQKQRVFQDLKALRDGKTTRSGLAANYSDRIKQVSGTSVYTSAYPGMYLQQQKSPYQGYGGRLNACAYPTKQSKYTGFQQEYQPSFNLQKSQFDLPDFGKSGIKSGNVQQWTQNQNTAVSLNPTHSATSAAHSIAPVHSIAPAQSISSTTPAQSVNRISANSLSPNPTALNYKTSVHQLAADSPMLQMNAGRIGAHPPVVFDQSSVRTQAKNHPQLSRERIQTRSNQIVKAQAGTPQELLEPQNLQVQTKNPSGNQLTYPQRISTGISTGNQQINCFIPESSIHPEQAFESPTGLLSGAPNGQFDPSTQIPNRFEQEPRLTPLQAQVRESALHAPTELFPLESEPLLQTQVVYGHVPEESPAASPRF